jgi:hypothetical protein
MGDLWVRYAFVAAVRVWRANVVVGGEKKNTTVRWGVLFDATHSL